MLTLAIARSLTLSDRPDQIDSALLRPGRLDQVGSVQALFAHDTAY